MATAIFLYVPAILSVLTIGNGIGTKNSMSNAYKFLIATGSELNIFSQDINRNL